jgi:hypothetical protein
LFESIYQLNQWNDQRGEQRKYLHAANLALSVDRERCASPPGCFLALAFSTGAAHGELMLLK